MATKITTVAQATAAGAYDASHGAGSYSALSASTDPTASFNPGGGDQGSPHYSTAGGGDIPPGYTFPGQAATPPAGTPPLSPTTSPTTLPGTSQAPTPQPNPVSSTTPTNQITPPKNILPYDQALANLQKGGLQGNNLKAATDGLRDYYQKFIDSNVGKNAPSAGGEARDALTSFSQTQPTTGAYSPSPEIQTGISDTLSVYTKAIADYLNPSNQRTSLVDEYKQMSNELGIPGLQSELIDTNRIMNGTEDDIRSEVTAAGGFATESQVQAMTVSRNKSLLKKAQFLQDQLTGAKDQLNTMVNLSAQDRQYADQRMQTGLGLLGNLVQIQQSMKKASVDNYNNIISQVGYGGLAQMTAGDPFNTKLVENTLGLAPGGLAQLAQADTQNRSLDTEYKKAQIANIYDEIKNRGATSGVDPGQIVGYAQQYASTGQIPTNLPKGVFGAIAQYAKELPKVDGEIVDNNTGVRPGKLTSTQIDAYAALKDLTNKIDQADTLFKTLNTGLIGGTLGNLFPTQDRQSYNTLRSEITDLLARARTGAAISANEEALYNSKIPGTYNRTLFLGTSGSNKLEGLKKSISDKLDTGLKANGASMYGFTQVKLSDGKNYTVGQIITNGDQAGRVNPDGSITYIN